MLRTIIRQRCYRGVHLAVIVLTTSSTTTSATGCNIGRHNKYGTAGALVVVHLLLRNEHLECSATSRSNSLDTVMLLLRLLLLRLRRQIVCVLWNEHCTRRKRCNRIASCILKVGRRSRRGCADRRQLPSTTKQTGGAFPTTRST
uniref:Putative secreted protein n=1 Tax=Anopheles triannulatus TaxID=58253 RepID=A0A2M4B111_9DIPT